MKKRLILITSGFPYGKSETFLETEIKYLAEGFEEIHILCPQPSDSHLRRLPHNCTVSFYNKTLSAKDKLLALGGLFSTPVRIEIKIIRSIYQLSLSKGVLSTLLISLFQAKRLAQLCKEQFLADQQEQETVFYSYWCDDTALALALLKQEYPGIKCVSRTHGWDVYFGVHELNYLPFRHLITEQLNAIFTISNKGKQEIRNTWKVKELNKVHLSRLGVQKQAFKTKEDNAMPVLVSCSNIIPLKRVHLIAEAVVQFQTPIKWVHFGDGVEEESIQAYCKTNSKEHHDISFKGRVPNAEVLRFYESNKVDALINVSSSEGVPVSIMEAMSFGIPCIATDVGGNKEIVNNKNGVLLAANPSLNAIQTAIKSCLNDESKRKAAYQTWEEEYNAERNYTAFVDELLNA